MEPNETPSISMNIEIPEHLYNRLVEHAQSRGISWDQMSTSMAALYLMQNGRSDAQTNSLYLDSLFRTSA